jgi:tetratricopeptide (TPR) repeat protein
MSIKTLTLASIYELQGLKEEAIEIYREILREDSDNIDALIAIKRLSREKRNFEGVNIQMRDFFVNMNSSQEFAEFERWLTFNKG